MLRPPRHAAPYLAALAVVALTLGVWSGTLSAEFTRWDDGTTIYQNPNLGDLGLKALAWAFTDTATTMRWIPLTHLSLSLTHTLHGLDPFGYHLHSWLLHAGAALALFLLLRELLGRSVRGAGDRDAPWVLVSAAAGALAWSLHPLRAEVVAWANSRGHVQAGLLTFLSLWVHLRAQRADAPPAGPWRGVALSVALFLAALLSHPIAIGAAPLFVLLDVHLGRLGGAAGWRGPAARRVLLEKLPLVVMTVAVLAITLLVRVLWPGRWPAPVPLSEWGLFPRAMQATYVWVHHAAVTLWPVGLQPAPTELIDFDPWTAPFLLRAVAVAAITGGLVRLRHRWPRALLLWLAWLSLLVPALGLTEHPMFACDRYANLPGLVPAALVGGGLLWLGAAAPRPALAAVGAAALLAVLGGMAHAQARAWTDSVTLFRHMLALLGEHPYRANVFAMLALAHGDRGEAAAAEAAWRQAALVSPDAPELQARLGHLVADAGRHAEAVEALGRAVALEPDNVEYRCLLAASLVELGRRGEAFDEVRAAFRLDPDARCLPWLLARLQGGPPR